MRKLTLVLMLAGLTACEDKLTGPEAQAAVRAHRSEAVSWSPLVLVDGVEADTADLARLDEKKIESIEVMKGRAAQQRYGERAYKGVIVISLKRGK